MSSTTSRNKVPRSVTCVNNQGYQSITNYRDELSKKRLMATDDMVDRELELLVETTATKIGLED